MGSALCCEQDEQDQTSDSDDEGTLVTLHVYDVSHRRRVKYANAAFQNLGTGIYHTAVEVYGSEWSYGQSATNGVFSSVPKQCSAHRYRQSVEMGYTMLSRKKFRELIAELRKEWRGPEYNLVRHNCTHFCSALCLELGVGDIPRWLQSFAGGLARVSDGAQAIKAAIARKR